MTEQDIPSQPVQPQTPPAAPQNKTPSDKLPTPETITKCADYTVLDKTGTPHTFKSLYDEPDKARVLIIFIRHFFCGNCQELVATLAESIPPSTLLTSPTPTSIKIIGCGDPALIDFYTEATKSPYPVYADPEQKLYKELGLISTLALGSTPDYFRSSMARLVGRSIVQRLSYFRSGLMNKGGPAAQNGGEFLFEKDGEVTWCHRMRNTRDHTGIEGLKVVLGLE